VPSLLSSYSSDPAKIPKALSIYSSLIASVASRRPQSSIPKPHQFVQEMMELFVTNHQGSDRSVHGKYFEYVIGESLARQGVRCLYYQAEVLHIPLAVFDWFLYHEKTPVSVSCKTKARDRWKQAAYEAMALKQVYSQATNYLITMEPLGAIEKKKVEAPGTIDHYLIATEATYSDAVREIAEIDFVEAKPKSPVVKGILLS